MVSSKTIKKDSKEIKPEADSAFVKPKKETKEKTAIKAKKEKKVSSEKISSAVMTPHITEKAASLKDENIFVFKIAPSLNKIMVKEEVKKIYGVYPLAVRIINIQGKKIVLKRRLVQAPGYKKAVVYFKKGESIKI